MVIDPDIGTSTKTWELVNCYIKFVTTIAVSKVGGIKLI